ncbi:sigma-70 family RNA polymerase sigma factor [Caulobacter vibrioides]|uniref:sigma-70 family RNA polymerase sigma factor n=1 Tax=Caulobacter vibrioides TaxID=155892 RepID=UPI000BB4A761|nr:sigma-70 family RNA polymerase sigma factor [Caulobacter vibrioides]ATC23618.1 RNA polymerase subunit sigma [Caulobacter vibrioides]PLR11788.1 RNA polymerase subunit sigma [Caulobacter vibrioides]
MYATGHAQARSRGGARVNAAQGDGGALITRIAETQDRAAFAELFQHYAPRVKTLLVRSGSTPSAAEELAQEVMLAVWRKAHYFDPKRASAAAWIFTIARNLRIDSLRRGSSALYAVDLNLGAEEPPQPDAILSGMQDAQIVRSAMQTLNPDQSQAIEMAFFQEQTHSQISEALGVPLGTVKARIRFGMMKLRAFIEREAGVAS